MIHHHATHDHLVWSLPDIFADFVDDRGWSIVAKQCALCGRDSLLVMQDADVFQIEAWKAEHEGHNEELVQRWALGARHSRRP